MEVLMSDPEIKSMPDDEVLQQFNIQIGVFCKTNSADDFKTLCKYFYEMRRRGLLTFNTQYAFARCCFQNNKNKWLDQSSPHNTSIWFTLTEYYVSACYRFLKLKSPERVANIGNLMQAIFDVANIACCFVFKPKTFIYHLAHPNSEYNTSVGPLTSLAVFDSAMFLMTSFYYNIAKHMQIPNQLPTNIRHDHLLSLLYSVKGFLLQENSYHFSDENPDSCFQIALTLSDNAIKTAFENRRRLVNLALSKSVALVGLKRNDQALLTIRKALQLHECDKMNVTKNALLDLQQLISEITGNK